MPLWIHREIFAWCGASNRSVVNNLRLHFHGQSLFEFLLERGKDALHLHISANYAWRGPSIHKLKIRLNPAEDSNIILTRARKKIDMLNFYSFMIQELNSFSSTKSSRVVDSPLHKFLWFGNKLSNCVHLLKKEQLKNASFSTLCASPFFQTLCQI